MQVTIPFLRSSVRSRLSSCLSQRSNIFIHTFALLWKFVEIDVPPFTHTRTYVRESNRDNGGKLNLLEQVIIYIYMFKLVRRWSWTNTQSFQSLSITLRPLFPNSRCPFRSMENYNDQPRPTSRTSLRESAIYLNLVGLIRSRLSYRQWRQFRIKPGHSIVILGECSNGWKRRRAPRISWDPPWSSSNSSHDFFSKTANHAGP